MRKPHVLLAFFALSALAFVGCDSNDEDEYSSILGRWEALDNASEEDVYLNIADDEIVAYIFIDDQDTITPCYLSTNFEVVSRDGNEWTIRSGIDTEVVIFRRDGDVLVTESPDIEDGDIVRFERSTRTDFDPICF